MIRSSGEKTPNARRLAKNTALMYARMIILMLISLYTSRIVLQQLGVSDFGIYNLVGSVVAVFSSLRGLFSSSTQRFLNYEMGQGHEDRLRIVYNMSILINVLLTIAFVLIVEIVGIWFLNYKINIPPDRLIAAKWVFQFSVITAAISIMTTPYDAEIIAHEDMNFYAYISVIEGVVKILIVYLLVVIGGDHLIVYGLLLLIVAILIRIANSYYCKKKYKECSLCRCWDKYLFLKMTKFAGWSFLGNTSYSMSQNGLNMVLNYFCGTLINAARGIAYQVLSVMSQLSSNIVLVIKPYCIKTFFEGKQQKTLDTLFFSGKLLFLAQLALGVPFIFLTKEVLGLWLVNVPAYTVGFVRLTILYSIFRSLAPVIDILFEAVGDLKIYQIVQGIVLLLPLLFSAILLSLGYSCYWAFVMLIVFQFFDIALSAVIAKPVTGISFVKFFRCTVLPCFTCLLPIAIGFIYSEGGGVIIRIIVVFLIFIIDIPFMFFIGMSKDEKALLKRIIYKKERD